MRAATPASSPRSGGRSAIETVHRLALLDVNARDTQIGGAMTVCLIAFVGVLLRRSEPGTSFGWWIVAVTLAASLRAMISWAWRRERSGPDFVADDRAVRRWGSAYVASAFGTGAAWASLVIVASDDLAIPVTLILALALVLASTTSAGSRLATLTFAVPIVVAQEINLIRLTLDGLEDGALLAGLWILVAVVLFFVKRHAALELRRNLVDSIDHERRASEQTALLENAPLGILVLRNTRIVLCNDALLKMFGYASKDDLVGQSIRVLIPDDESWRETLRYVEATREGPAPSRIVRRKRADGSVVAVMLTIATVESVGADAEFIAIYKDVGERLAAEENYRHALRMQRLVFESAGEGIAIVRDGVIEQANQALADLLGSSMARLTDLSFETIFEDPEGWAEIERRIDRQGTALKVERRIVRFDGRAVWVNLTGRAVDRDDQGPFVNSGPVTQRSIWVLADLSVQKQKEAENWHLANHDVMTGLPNRRFLQDRLDQALASARRDGRRVAVVELDLDGFKTVNDDHGHRFGDAVLEEVARRLSTIVRELDTVGRWGGDEFVLVLREIESADVVEETIKRVIARLSEPIVYMGQTLSIGVSIGIALYPDHGDAVEVLVLAADLAMYESKGAGGNTWRFAGPAAQAGARGKYRSAEFPS